MNRIFPESIVQLIFEFDSTYHDVMRSVLTEINPPYYYWLDKHKNGFKGRFNSIQKLNGTKYTYSPEGNLVEKCFYDRGLKEGLEECFYPDGSLAKTLYYHLGLRHGPFTSYHPNGKVQCTCFFEYGLLEGQYTVYPKNNHNQLSHNRFFRNGLL